MNPHHQILPRQPSPIPPTERLAIYLFLSLFLIFSFLLLGSRLAETKVTGRAQDVATSVNVTGGLFYTCNLTLRTGMNLVSVPCLPLNFPREDFFNNLSSGGANVEVIYKYTPQSNGQWEVYNASLPSYVVQNLYTFNAMQGIYFRMAAPESLTYNGPISSLNNIPLLRGWNLVGYPSLTTRNLSESIASINDTYLLIKTLEGTEEMGTYLADTPPPGNETLTNTSIYHGYWIRQSANDVWQVLP